MRLSVPLAYDTVQLNPVAWLPPAPPLLLRPHPLQILTGSPWLVPRPLFVLAQESVSRALGDVRALGR